MSRLLALALLLVLTACASPPVTPTTTTAHPETSSAPEIGQDTVTTIDPGVTTTESTTTTLTTTTSPTTSAPTTTTVSATPPGHAFSVEAFGLFPPTFEGSDGAAGTGCSPGTETLPDGAWFGFVDSRTATGIEFDLACFWTGDRANEVAMERGETDVPLPNDYLITNDNPALRTVTIGAEVDVYPVGDTTQWPPVPVPFAEWPVAEELNPVGCHLTGEYQFCIVWLFVNGGVVTEMVEQYVP